MAETFDLAPIALATLATHRSLHDVEGAEQWPDREWLAPLKAVIQKQVTEPMEERRLRTKIPALTPIENSVSAAVRDQYEANPYPRWSRFASRHTPALIGDVLRGAPLHFDLGEYRPPEAPAVLIASCGTGQ